MKAIYASALLLATVLAACTDSDEAVVRRTSLEDWKRLEIPELGFSVEVPTGLIGKQVLNEQRYIDGTGGSTFVFSLHPIHIGALIEDRYVINAFFVVMTAKQYNIFEKGNKHHIYDNCYANTMHEFHPIRKEYDLVDSSGISATAFRRDYRDPEGGAVAIAIERLDYAGTESWRDGDVKAIDRILGSVEFLKPEKIGPHAPDRNR
jgi:hypothetical protein